MYYETTGATPDLTTNTWQVGMAQNYHVLSNPTDFVYYTATDHVIHTGPVCENGIGCNSTSPGNRNLADDFQVAIDPQGLANIAFTDDHDSTIPPQTYFTKQVWGYELGTPNGDGPNQGCSLYGTTLPPSGNAGSPVVVRLKAPAIGSQGWFTMLQNGAVLVAGPLTSYVPSSPTAATFTGTAMGGGGAFSGSIQNGTLQLVFNHAVVRAALTSGVTAFE